MKYKIKDILSKKTLWLFIIITFIFFGTLTRMEFAADTYATLTFSIKELIKQFASSGRFIVVFAGVILKLLELKSETIYLLSFTFAIICMFLSLYKLYNIIKSDIKSNIAQKIIPLLIILNIFSIELFLYIEKGIMLFAVLMCVFAAGDIKKWLQTKQKKYLITTFIFMLLANFSYQGVVGIFVAISMVFILKYSKNIKEFILSNIVVALSYGIPAIIDYILIKIICASSRVDGNIILSESLQKIFIYTQDMIVKTYRILPEKFFMSLIISLIIIMLFKTIKQKTNIKNKIINILKIVYIIVGIVFVAIAPQLMQNTESIWMVARTTYTYATLFGILVLYFYINYENDKKTEYIIIILSLILLIVQFYRFNIIITDRYKVNEIDYETTRKVISQIEEYEKQTGITVSNISVYEDKSIEYSYRDIFVTGNINIKSYYEDWSIQYIIKYYSGRDLTVVEDLDPKIEEIFKQKDWEFFEEEQIIFKNDTLHICVY